MYVILLSSSNRKYEPFALFIVRLILRIHMELAAYWFHKNVIHNNGWRLGLRTNLINVSHSVHDRAYTVARCAQTKAHHRASYTRATHTTEPACFVNKRCLWMTYVGNVFIYEKCKYSYTHTPCIIYKARFIVTSGIFKVSYFGWTGRSCAILFQEWLVVCVYLTKLCAGRLGCKEGYP